MPRKCLAFKVSISAHCTCPCYVKLGCYLNTLRLRFAIKQRRQVNSAALFLSREVQIAQISTVSTDGLTVKCYSPVCNTLGKTAPHSSSSWTQSAPQRIHKEASFYGFTFATEILMEEGGVMFALHRRRRFFKGLGKDNTSTKATTEYLCNKRPILNQDSLNVVGRHSKQT